MLFLSIFVLAFFGLTLPIPLLVVQEQYSTEFGFLVIAVAGVLSTIFFTFFSQPLRHYLLNKYGERAKYIQRTERYMAKYGTVGMGLVAPFILGHVPSAIAGIILGAPPRPLAFWMSLGVVFWTAVYYALFRAGVAAFN